MASATVRYRIKLAVAASGFAVAAACAFGIWTRGAAAIDADPQADRGMAAFGNFEMAVLAGACFAVLPAAILIWALATRPSAGRASRQ